MVITVSADQPVASRDAPSVESEENDNRLPVTLPEQAITADIEFKRHILLTRYSWKLLSLSHLSDPLYIT